MLPIDQKTNVDNVDMDFVMCTTPQLERTGLLLFISLTGVSMAPKRAGQAEHIHLQPRWDL